MSGRDLLRLFVLLNRGTRRRLVAANVGLTLGVTLVVLFVAAGSGLRRVLLEDVLGTLPLDQLKVQPRTMSLGGVKVDRPGLGKLDGAVVDSLRRVPGVVSVHPIAYAHFPVSIQGDVLGSTYGTDAPLMGVDPAWVADEVSPDYDFSDESARTVPVLVSRKVLQAYNAGFARANRLPELGEGVIIGQELTIAFGISTLGGEKAGREVRPATIVGFSDRVDALALAVPLGVIQGYAARFDEDADRFDAVVVRARSTGDVARVERVALDLGLEPTPDAYIGRQVGRAVTIVTIMLSAVGVLVVLLSLLNIGNTLLLVVRERQYELGVARAVGVSARLLGTILVGEAALSGLVSAVLALSLGALVLWAGGNLLAERLGAFLTGGARFAVPTALAIATLLLTPLAAIGAALEPTRRAIGTSIATALRR